MVEVGAEHDIFVLQNGIAALEDAEDIGTLHPPDIVVSFDVDLLGQREALRLAAFFPISA